MSGIEGLDLDAYFARIGFGGKASPDLATLRGLHLAHATAIPFENLDIQLGRPIRLDLESLQAKLVAGRRGGYCFEHNSLFAAALRAVGFRVATLAARVRMGQAQPMPRTHMLLQVDLAEGAFLADVGFGGEGLLGPVPMDGTPAAQYAWTYRVIRDGDLAVLQSKRGGGWLDLYAFSFEPQHPVDYEVANHFTSTHPGSRFVTTLTAQLPTPEARHILRNRTYGVMRGETLEERTVEEGELLPLLKEVFGLDFPQGTRFRALGA